MSKDEGSTLNGHKQAYNSKLAIFHEPRTISEQSRARQIIEKYSCSVYDYFKIYPVKSYYFSADNQCFIAYQVSAGTALCLGDPTGPDNKVESTLLSFLEFCRFMRWHPAFIVPELPDLYLDFKFKVWKFGEEAIIDLNKFSNHTINRRVFRRSSRGLESNHYTFTEHLPPHTTKFLDELESVSKEWLTLPGRREHGFTEGRFDRIYLNQMLIYTIDNSFGEAIAFTNRIPSYLPYVCSADLMRHRLNSPYGTMEYLLSSLLLLLNDRGYKKFSMALVPFSGIGNSSDSTLLERFIYLVYRYSNHFYSFRGLRHFKEQFEPEWIDRFLVYQDGPIGLPRTLLSLMRLTSRLNKTQNGTDELN